MTNLFHHFSEQQCSIIRESLGVRHAVLVDKLWDATSYPAVSDAAGELHALVDAYSYLWHDPNAMATVHDEAYVLREKARINVQEKLLSLGSDNDV